MYWQEHIVTGKDVLSGKPSVKGSRTAIDHVAGLLAQGQTGQQLPANYPRLAKGHLKAILSYQYNCIQDGKLQTR